MMSRFFLSLSLHSLESVFVSPFSSEELRALIQRSPFITHVLLSHKQRQRKTDRMFNNNDSTSDKNHPNANNNKKQPKILSRSMNLSVKYFLFLHYKHFLSLFFSHIFYDRTRETQIPILA